MVETMFSLLLTEEAAAAAIWKGNEYWKMVGSLSREILMP